MSETQTVTQTVVASKEDSEEKSKENNAQSESRRGSQAITSPIRSLFNKAQSFTQRSQKSSRVNSVDENIEGNANKTISAIGPANDTIAKILGRVEVDLLPNTQPALDVIDASNAQPHQNGTIDIKVHEHTNSSPTRHGKVHHHQILHQENGHTISVRIEGRA